MKRTFSMANNAIKLNTNDQSVEVLYRSILLAETIYQSVNNPLTNKIRFEDHKNSINELVSEINKAIVGLEGRNKSTIYLF